MRTTQSLGLTGVASGETFFQGKAPRASGTKRRWALTASLHRTRLRDVRIQRGRITMTKSRLLLIGLFLAVPLGAVEAQTGGINNQRSQAVPGNQGLIGTPLFQSISPAKSP